MGKLADAVEFTKARALNASHILNSKTKQRLKYSEILLADENIVATLLQNERLHENVQQHNIRKL